MAAAKNRPKGIIANPNCSTIQMVVALKPLHDAARIKHIIVSTYQATSGKGHAAVEDLLAAVARRARGQGGHARRLPRTDRVQRALRLEGRRGRLLRRGVEDGPRDAQDHGRRHDRRLADDRARPRRQRALRVGPRAVPSPDERRGGEAAPPRRRGRRADGGGVRAGQAPAAGSCAGTDPVFVGRVRDDLAVPGAIDMFVVADNLRKGAALNAVQIAERLFV